MSWLRLRISPKYPQISSVSEDYMAERWNLTTRVMMRKYMWKNYYNRSSVWLHKIMQLDDDDIGEQIVDGVNKV